MDFSAHSESREAALEAHSHDAESQRRSRVPQTHLAAMHHLYLEAGGAIVLGDRHREQPSAVSAAGLLEEALRLDPAPGNESRRGPSHEQLPSSFEQLKAHILMVSFAILGISATMFLVAHHCYWASPAMEEEETTGDDVSVFFQRDHNVSIMEGLPGQSPSREYIHGRTTEAHLHMKAMRSAAQSFSSKHAEGEEDAVSAVSSCNEDSDARSEGAVSNKH